MPTLLDTAIERIVFSRGYTVRLLDKIDAVDWFRMPTPEVTHIAWQVGHLAMAEYRLVLERIRGERPEDSAMISPEFLKAFGKQSVPHSDPNGYPSPAEIRAVFDRVHRQALDELPGLPEADWFSPPVTPHSLYNRKIDSLFWCAHHEMLHAGQIGLLRRLLGFIPVW
jgi:hypothetical protein